uniref:(northern house mosquito) hypothetical protein n=1 Tax=Culex pipiens TaxID=7175 RepID=A0A8D8CAB0_CULPI
MLRHHPSALRSTSVRFKILFEFGYLLFSHYRIIRSLAQLHCVRLENEDLLPIVPMKIYDKVKITNQYKYIVRTESTHFINFSVFVLLDLNCVALFFIHHLRKLCLTATDLSHFEDLPIEHWSFDCRMCAIYHGKSWTFLVKLFAWVKSELSCRVALEHFAACGV